MTSETPDATAEAARDLRAVALEQLGYQAENGTWRNEYRMGAKELREGAHDPGSVQPAGSDVLAAMTLDMLPDYLGIRLDGPAAWLRTGALNWTFADFDGAGKQFAVRLGNGTLVYTAEKILPDPDTGVYWDREAFQHVILGTTTLDREITSGAVRGSAPEATRTT